MLLTEEQLHFIQQSCWVSISHQENQVLFSQSFPQYPHHCFVPCPSGGVEKGGRKTHMPLAKRPQLLHLNGEAETLVACVCVCTCKCVCLCVPGSFGEW